MKQIKLLIKVFFSIFLITAFVACNIDEEGFEDSKLNSLIEGDDKLISAISNSKSKQSINIDQLPSTAQTTIDTDYSSMSSENSSSVVVILGNNFFGKIKLSEISLIF